MWPTGWWVDEKLLPFWDTVDLWATNTILVFQSKPATPRSRITFIIASPVDFTMLLGDDIVQRSLAMAGLVHIFSFVTQRYGTSAMPVGATQRSEWKSEAMTKEQQLIGKLQRIESLFARATTPGERTAAGNALERILQRLEETRQVDPPIEYTFSMPDMWSRKLFVALLRRYGIQPYRYYRQRYTTVMASVPRRFVDETLWPEYEKLNEILRGYLEEITDHVISEAVFADKSDVEVRDDANMALPDR